MKNFILLSALVVLAGAIVGCGAGTQVQGPDDPGRQVETAVDSQSGNAASTSAPTSSE
jgi:hypothetical protein